MIQQSFLQFNGIYKHLVGFSVVGSGSARFFVEIFDFFFCRDRGNMMGGVAQRLQGSQQGFTENSVSQ